MKLKDIFRWDAIVFTLIVAAFFYFISGCAPKALTLQDFHFSEKETAVRDSAGCRKEGNEYANSRERYNAIYESCMMSKGYKPKRLD